MRTLTLLLAVAFLSGCGVNTTFNQRYEPKAENGGSTQTAARPAQTAPVMVVPAVADASRPPSVEPIHGGYRVERLVSIDEADRYRVDMADWPAVVGKNLPIELKGATLPRRDGGCQTETNLARAARETVRETFTAAQRITLVEISRAEHFALRARVKMDGADLAEKLIAEGLAVNEGEEAAWCR